MSASRNKVNELLEFFGKTDRKCVVVWERTIPKSNNKTIGISAGGKDTLLTDEHVDFFHAVAEVLHQAADQIEAELDDDNEAINGF